MHRGVEAASLVRYSETDCGDKRPRFGGDPRYHVVGMVHPLAALVAEGGSAKPTG
jgi:hypothetical protein